MFVERAAELSTNVVALLLPSSLSDLEGYASMREVLSSSHRPSGALSEFGQDAFPGVVQPCFALIAVREPHQVGSRAPWQLCEKGRASDSVRVELAIPEALRRLREGSRLPAELFGELGFQTNRVVSESLLSRSGPSERHVYPLLEGKDVREFSVRPPRVFLEPNRGVLAKEKVRLRAESDYRRAKFLVRQTAAYPIAALHTGLPFRNSLLAGYENAEYSAALLVGLLNSTLLRSYHLSSQRDARQLTFPQLKVQHLRSLPAPTRLGREAEELISLVQEVTTRGVFSKEERAQLDSLVFSLYALRGGEGAEVLSYFEKKCRRSA